MFAMTQRKFGIDGPNVEIANIYCSAGKDANKDIKVANGYCPASKDANKVTEVAKGLCSKVGADALKKIIDVGKLIFSKVAEDAMMNNDDSVSLNDNHLGGSKSLACRSGTELHIENSGVRCDAALGERMIGATRILVEIQRVCHVMTIPVDAKLPHFFDIMIYSHSGWC